MKARIKEWLFSIIDLLRVSALLIGCLYLSLIILWVLLVITGGRFLPIVGTAVIVGAVLIIRSLWNRVTAVRAFRASYGAAGKDLLIVLTDSPHWKPYIEREWIPRWGSRAVILNRSLQWRKDTPEARLWNAVKGTKDHTPLAVVVPRRGRIRVVRFFKAFRDNKHGKDPKLRKQEETLAKALAPQPPGALSGA